MAKANPPLPAPEAGRKPGGVGLSLFGRTFLLLGVLLLGSVLAWFQTLRTLEEEPRAVQSAQQLASLVNLTRAALAHADPIARISLVTTLLQQENLRIAVRESADTHLPYDQDRLSRRISAELAHMLGPQTLVARQVNGFDGLWIGFEIGGDNFWLLADQRGWGKWAAPPGWSGSALRRPCPCSERRCLPA